MRVKHGVKLGSKNITRGGLTDPSFNDTYQEDSIPIARCLSSGFRVTIPDDTNFQGRNIIAQWKGNSLETPQNKLTTPIKLLDGTDLSYGITLDTWSTEYSPTQGCRCTLRFRVLETPNGDFALIGGFRNSRLDAGIGLYDEKGFYYMTSAGPSLSDVTDFVLGDWYWLKSEMFIYESRPKYYLTKELSEEEEPLRYSDFLNIQTNYDTYQDYYCFYPTRGGKIEIDFSHSYIQKASDSEDSNKDEKYYMWNKGGDLSVDE